MQPQTDSLIDMDQNGLPDALEQSWGKVLQVVNAFLKNHDQFGFELVEKKSSPSLEDMLLSLKMMGSILELLLGAAEESDEDVRLLLNAKQQIVWFEQAALALKRKDEPAYAKCVTLMKNQAQF